MNTDFYDRLKEEGYISNASFEKIREKERNPLFSVHWELKTLLYLGVMLLSTGLGILVYKNIDTIGHQVILGLIAAICIGCFTYCLKNRPPFSREQVKSPNSLFDYFLLLGCLSFLTFVGYLQYQYTVFGTNYGMATFIPMVVLFLVAYEFDHLGILSMAIANLAIWMGVSVTPAQLLSSGNFDNQKVIYTYVLLGLILLAAGWFTETLNFKKHFRFSYFHFGIHISFISLLFGYFNHYDSPISFLWLAAVFILAYFLYLDALKHRSFYFLLLVVIYTYIAFSSLIFRGLINIPDIGSVYIGFIYFIGSAIALIRILIHLHKKIKA
ncbi:DUF2157 domain-containing protein [Pedobacter steynii]|uniref:DUF2157 domain-containing protein n=1 Tax=Pedobacter steynii TaxID=430522 RepID=A0A1D7QDB2_9SPHI|nr:DUF2157 domain-containing protein [Pedobacter steynii]AOM76569.1 DUF2157 domain-containing protein [Pedobacter steynii]